MGDGALMLAFYHAWSVGLLTEETDFSGGLERVNSEQLHGRALIVSEHMHGGADFEKKQVHGFEFFEFSSECYRDTTDNLHGAAHSESKQLFGVEFSELIPDLYMDQVMIFLILIQSSSVTWMMWKFWIKLNQYFPLDSMHFVPHNPARPCKQLVLASIDDCGSESFAFDKQIVRWGLMLVNTSVVDA